VVICKAFSIYFIIIITIKVIKLKKFFDTSIGIIICYNWLNYRIITKTAYSISIIIIDL
jgi:hypothetical protein